MKNRLMDMTDKMLLRKRSIIETINNELKKYLSNRTLQTQVFANFIVNLLSGLIAYSFFSKKPSVKHAVQQYDLLNHI